MQLFLTRKAWSRSVHMHNCTTSKAMDPNTIHICRYHPVTSESSAYWAWERQGISQKRSDKPGPWSEETRRPGWCWQREQMCSKGYSVLSCMQTTTLLNWILLFFVDCTYRWDWIFFNGFRKLSTDRGTGNELTSCLHTALLQTLLVKTSDISRRPDLWGRSSRSGPHCSLGWGSG
jgi:hypothetical protein